MNKVAPKVIATLDGDLNQPVIVLDEHEEHGMTIALIRLADGEYKWVDARRIINQEVK